jgi:hypothetical protein
MTPLCPQHPQCLETSESGELAATRISQFGSTSDYLFQLVSSCLAYASLKRPRLNNGE